MWLTRLKSLALPQQRGTAIGGTIAAAGLIIAGLIFAGTATRQVHEAILPSSQNASNQNSNKPSNNSSQNVGESPDQGSTTTSAVTVPVTIIGPNGETITLPPQVTSPSVNDSGQPTSPTQFDNGTTSNTQSSTNTSVVTNQPTSSTNNNSFPLPTLFPSGTNPPPQTTTTTRPIPNQQQPEITVTVVGGTSPEDPSVQLNISASDPDGLITQIDVTWDAGGIYETVASDSRNACEISLPSSISKSVSHMYATPGTHSVSVTVTTISCENFSQQASRSITLTSGGTDSTTTTTTTTTIPEEPEDPGDS